MAAPPRYISESQPQPQPQPDMAICASQLFQTMAVEIEMEQKLLTSWRAAITAVGQAHGYRNHGVDCVAARREHQHIPVTFSGDTGPHVYRMCSRKASNLSTYFRHKTCSYDRLLVRIDSVFSSGDPLVRSLTDNQISDLRSTRRGLVLATQHLIMVTEEFARHMACLAQFIDFLFCVQHVPVPVPSCSDPSPASSSAIATAATAAPLQPTTAPVQPTRAAFVNPWDALIRDRDRDQQGTRRASLAVPSSRALEPLSNKGVTRARQGTL